MRTVEATILRNDLQPTSVRRNIMLTLVLALVRILALVLALFMGVVVVLLPLSTAVPVWVWLPLALADVGLVILPFRIKSAWQGVTISLVGMTLVSLMAIGVSQAFVMTPSITDSADNIIPGSIATLEKVTLNGTQQWISIRGTDVNQPVLLFLAGGPGGSQLVTARRTLRELEDHFIVVNWEQPGAGKSFDAVDRATLTPERYIADGTEMVRYLRERFHQDKIYLLGESWGSALGIWLIQREPGLYHAFIGTGQMVAFLENDLMCYDFALQLMQAQGKLEKVERLKAQGPPPYYGQGVALKEAAFLMETFNYMNADPAIADDGFNTFQDLAGPEYGLYDKLNWFRGALETMDAVYPQLWAVDLRIQATELDVPVYFLIGRHDVNAPPVLTEQYYEQLNAPHKALIWFEHSGHNPWVTESAAFVDVLVNTVLVQTQSAP